MIMDVQHAAHVTGIFMGLTLSVIHHDTQHKSKCQEQVPVSRRCQDMCALLFVQRLMTCSV